METIEKILLEALLEPSRTLLFTYYILFYIQEENKKIFLKAFWALPFIEGKVKDSFLKIFWVLSVSIHHINNFL